MILLNFVLDILALFAKHRFVVDEQLEASISSGHASILNERQKRIRISMIHGQFVFLNLFSPSLTVVCLVENIRRQIKRPLTK
jgi:hypothetical protein